MAQHVELIPDLLALEAGRTDIFGRQKVAVASSQFTYQNEYNKGPFQWVEKLTAGGTSTHVPATATVLLSVAAAGDAVIRQTRRYFRYFSGKELSVTMTYSAQGLRGDSALSAGYFDGSNGLFLRVRPDFVELVLRSQAGGDRVVRQSDWNGDRLDGTGKSGVTYDFTRSTILAFSLQWLGVGNVTAKIELPNGDLVAAHTFQNAGVIFSTYMRTANLPVRYELVADAGFAGAASTCEAICAAVSVEDGGWGDISSYSHSVNNETTEIAVSTRRGVLAIRPKATYGGQVNRASVKAESVAVVTRTSNVLWELVYNPATFGGTPSWSSAGDYSTMEFSVNVTTITGGIVIASGYGVDGGRQVTTTALRALQSNYPLSLDVDGANPTSLVLMATSFSGTANVASSMSFEEIF